MQLLKHRECLLILMRKFNGRQLKFLLDNDLKEGKIHEDQNPRLYLD
jgi:hypothetical protein